MEAKDVQEITKEVDKLKRVVYRLVKDNGMNLEGVVAYDKLTHQELSALHRQSEIRRDMLEERLEMIEKENRQLRIDMSELQQERNKYSQENFILKAQAEGKQRVVDKATNDIEVNNAAIRQLMTLFDYHEATQIMEEVREGKTDIHDIAKLLSDRHLDLLSELDRYRKETSEKTETSAPSIRSLILGKRKKKWS